MLRVLSAENNDKFNDTLFACINLLMVYFHLHTHTHTHTHTDFSLHLLQPFKRTLDC